MQSHAFVLLGGAIASRITDGLVLAADVEADVADGLLVGDRFFRHGRAMLHPQRCANAPRVPDGLSPLGLMELREERSLLGFG